MNSCSNTNILLNTFHIHKSPKKKKHAACETARHMHLSSTCNYQTTFHMNLEMLLHVLLVNLS